MNIKWIAAVVMIWIIGTTWGAMFEKEATCDTESTLNYLVNFKNIAYQDDDVGVSHFVVINDKYFDTLAQTVSWNFTFLKEEPGYEMAKNIAMSPITIAVLLGFILAFASVLMGIINKP